MEKEEPRFWVVVNGSKIIYEAENFQDAEENCIEERDEPQYLSLEQINMMSNK